MRTTLTLDPDVAERLQQEMKHRGVGLKEAVNEALRKGLNLAQPKTAKPFRVQPHDFRFTPGLDLERMNQLVDELDVQEAARRLQA